METEPSDFVDWLQSELDTRGWRQAELARRGGLHTGHLSKVLSRERKPGVEFCRGVAHAFNMRDTDVMKIAGLAASTSPDDQTPSVRELVGTFNELSDENQETILKMLRALNEMEQAEKRRGLKLKTRTG